MYTIRIAFFLSAQYVKQPANCGYNVDISPLDTCGQPVQLCADFAELDGQVEVMRMMQVSLVDRLLLDVLG